jgi:OFA family oxalate/formate antiporter-like MFS transporter
MTVQWRELREGWPVIAIGMLTLLSAFGAPTFALPFIFPALIEEYDWSREQVTLLATYKFIAGAFAAVLLGKLVDVLGVRTVLIAASLLVACSMSSFMLVDGLVGYYSAGICLGVGAAGTVVGVQVLIARHMHHHQGVAIGIVMVGASAGGVIVPPLVAILLELYEWRIAIATLGLGVWLITLPLLIFVLNREKRDDSQITGDRGGAEVGNPGGLSLTSFVSGSRFWLIACGLILVAMVDQGITQHTVLFLELDVGLRATTVVTAMSLFSLFGILGKVFFGWVYDRISVSGIALVYFLLAVSALLALPVAGTITLFAFILVRGIAHGGLVIDVPVISKHCYGPRDLGRAIGIYTAILQLGFALGPWLMGRMHDRTGSYDQAFILFALLSVVAGLCLLNVAPEYWRSSIKKNTENPAKGVNIESQHHA